GRFLWERLDGTRTLRDLTLDYWDEFRAIAPHAVAEVIDRLALAGFLVLSARRPDVRALNRLPLWRRALLRVPRLVEWYVPVRGVDRILTRVYRAGGWVLYTRPAQVALALLSAAGIGAFVYESARDPLAGHTPVVALLLPALYGSVFLHELGHALTTKAY